MTPESVGGDSRIGPASSPELRWPFRILHSPAGPRLQALVFGHQLFMAFASAGDRAEFEASGAQQREAGAAHVMVDRVADVQLIDLVTRRDEN